jgi:hypothetical protein
MPTVVPMMAAMRFKLPSALENCDRVVTVRAENRSPACTGVPFYGSEVRGKRGFHWHALACPLRPEVGATGTGPHSERDFVIENHRFVTAWE